MSGVCITKIGHSCGSSDGLQVFENDDGSVSGYCFACSKYVADPFGDKRMAKDLDIPKPAKKSVEEIQMEMEEIYGLGKCPDLKSRRLRGASLDEFEIKVGYDERDGKTPRIIFFPYTKNGEIVKFKVRLLDEKRMWSISTDNDVDLFGWEQAKRSGAKRLIITEGEFDAVAMKKILQMHTKEAYKEFTPAVVSLPNGASSAAKDISKHVPSIRKYFSEVLLAFDQDEAGKKAVQAVLKVIPDAKVVELPCKDANDAIINGHTQAVFAAVTFKASKPKNTRLLRGSELREAAMVRPEMGLPWPWEKLTELTRGIRRKEVYYFGAGVKMGKSEVVNALAEHLIVKLDFPVLIIKPEEANARSYQNLVSKAAGKIFHDPNVEFDEEAFIEAEKLVGDKAIILDSYQFIDWEKLKDDIIYAVTNDGVRDIIIDPVTCFTNHLSASDTNEFLVKWAAEVKTMAQDLDATFYIFCHLKAPSNGEPHERGGEVLSTQFTGSRAMMRSCDMMIGIEGNKDPELPEMERNIRKLKILEERNLGASGIVKLYWDHKTGLFNEA